MNKRRDDILGRAVTGLGQLANLKESTVNGSMTVEGTILSIDLRV